MPDRIFWILPFFLLPQLLSAGHVLGGYMSYTCEEEGTFNFQMELLRDCNCANCALLDPTVQIAIYDCGTDGLCTDLSTADAIDVLTVSLSNVEYLLNNNPPCFGPPFPCYEVGKYLFSYTFPDLGHSYIVVFQRCCRALDIDNLIQPGETGLTIATQMTAAALTSCNNSPRIDLYPPLIICANQSYSLPVLFTDLDGDLLYYTTCPSLSGGGPIVVEPEMSTCDGALPNPPCPPPFNEANYIVPVYSANQPVLSDPPATLDLESGMWMLTPTTIGRFAMAMCVEEYRNGALLSKTQLEFVLNVVAETPLSTDEPEVGFLHVFPNPTRSGRLMVDLSDHKVTQLRLFDITGVLRYQERPGKTAVHVIPTNDLRSGCYFLIVDTAEGQFVEKVQLY